MLARYRGKVSRIYFRADAGFANPEVYEFLEAERIKYAIRLPANSVLPGRTAAERSAPVTCELPLPEAGRSRAGSSPRSNGIRANFIRVSA